MDRLGRVTIDVQRLHMCNANCLSLSHLPQKIHRFTHDRARITRKPISYEHDCQFIGRSYRARLPPISRFRIL